ncbi:precorrin-8X methylmutase [Paludibacter propionicigenes WB4]|uniref:Precorrin-8X methylmutase n=1 Tax=Paludibacter propionicigenes (strain DSM 17365 / JCM 13257 / WB4) TaxID=694427 RepID=E4T7K3_PALPW|nr:precorrin-8X methylmutase [Paludibacter propionicigenes]ADQ80697.1 precorrin-8X methylmutase [Paludibacter propionicigenes WB4]
MDAKNYIILNPADIETRSFEIITEELGHLNLSPELAPIVKRVVHTTADFDYARITEIQSGAVSSAVAALVAGCKIYSDTRMIIAGVSKPMLKKLNCELYTYVDDAEVSAQSKEKGLTRSILGIEKAVEDPDTRIFVIGNAPTALVRLGELIQEGKVRPALVIGVPVGFVGASESKEFIKKTGVPYIVTNGRKGGSTVAVAILNALLYTQR